MNLIHHSPELGHIFVSGGSPRSGKTLLRLVLSAHPLITITPETHFIQQLFRKRIPPYKRLNRKELVVVMQLMKADVKLNSWPAFCLHDFLKKLSSQVGITIAQLIDNLFFTFAKQTNGGTAYLGNKKGLYAEGYGLFTKKVFPDAKFIYIVRDPREAIRSTIKHISGYSLIKAAETCLLRYYYITRMRKCFPEDVLAIRYEDLVTKPEQICRILCDFLQISFDEQMLRFYELNRNSERLMGATKDTHQETTMPFKPDLIEKWQKEVCFSGKELQFIESIAHKYMKKFHYSLVTSPSTLALTATQLKVLSRCWCQDLRRRITK